MAHVFISYKREEVAEARRVRQALRAEKMTVWWDENLQAGQKWVAAIDEALVEASAVVVLWSRASSESEWVKHEASIAKSRGVLVPVRISECSPPGAFAEVQAVELLAWDGSERHPHFRDLVGVLRRIRWRQRLSVVAKLLAFSIGLCVAFSMGVLVDRRYLSRSDTGPPLVTRSSNGGIDPSTPVGSHSETPNSPDQGASSGELGTARRLESLVAEGKYLEATSLFDPLTRSHTSGVGYSAYPEAAFAFDQTDNPDEALRVLRLLRDRIANDASKGYGYLAPGRAPRQFLRTDFDRLLPRVKSSKVADDMTKLRAEL